jgi:predicted dehydrogenase
MSVKILVVGAGSRGTAYADYVHEHSHDATIVGVAEPRKHLREAMAQKHNIPRGNVFRDWKQVIEIDRIADAVIIATNDKMHIEPTLAFAKKGYHILLEKPMAPNEKDCITIVNAIKEARVIFAVCHVLRYTKYTQTLKEILDSKILGEIINIQHLEPVAYWHMAHSFVRGNWRNEAESSFMLLAKSCHDIDLICYLVGSRCIKVSSFGSLKYFKSENKPEGAGNNCMYCSCESECPYSAKKLYLSKANQGNFDWPVNVIADQLTVDGVTEALQKGPYGRCAYECDNNVVDNQVVNMHFENGCTVSFTMIGFAWGGDRTTRIFGSHGELYGDGSTITVRDFLTDTEKIHKPYDDGDSATEGHGGGDHNLMKAFINAVQENNTAKIKSGHQETLNSHLLVFAAEKSRRENRVISLVNTEPRAL